MSDYKQWLTSLKPGDKVLIQSTRNTPTLETVLRLTKTQIVLEDCTLKFRRSDGNIVGAETWSTASLKKPTTKRMQQVVEVRHRSKLLYTLRDTARWGTLPTGVLEEVIALINSEKAKD